MPYSCTIREEVVGGRRTGAGVSLPTGRRGSRFAFMNVGWKSRRTGDMLMLGTLWVSLYSTEDVMAMDVDASVASEDDDSQDAMMSVERFSTWFVLTL